MDDDGSGKRGRLSRRLWRMLSVGCVVAVLAACGSGAQEPSPLPQSGYAYPPPGGAAELHVGPNGDDGAAGSAQAPLRTIAGAAQRAQPGTVVIVADGTYEGSFVTRASGTEDGRIRFVAANKWGAKLLGDGGSADGDADAVWRNYGDYVDIQGFEISGSMPDGILQTGSYGRIVENRVHGFTEGCISTYRNDYSMVDNDIIGNVVFDCGSTKLHHGIYPGGPGGVISNNIAYGNAGFGIHCWHNCNRQVITNNLLFYNGEGGILIGQGDGPNNGDVPADDMFVANNIVVDNGTSAGIRESGATGANNRYVNNIVSGNKADEIGLRTGTETGTIIQEPVFVDYKRNGSGDYRLQPGSPGVDGGTEDQGVPDVDVLGRPRPQSGTVDIGPYEQ